MLLEERTAEFSYEYITRQWCDVEGLTMVRRWRDEGGRLRREERRVLYATRSLLFRAEFKSVLGFLYFNGA